LGATAALAVIGRGHKLLENRGQFFDHPRAKAVTATVHPSSILRAPDPASREESYRAFVQDLRSVQQKLKSL
jgi:DNA polymerase